MFLLLYNILYLLILCLKTPQENCANTSFSSTISLLKLSFVANTTPEDIPSSSFADSQVGAIVGGALVVIVIGLVVGTVWKRRKQRVIHQAQGTLRLSSEK